MQLILKLVFLVLVAIFLVAPTAQAQAIRAKDPNGRLVDVLADTLGRLQIVFGGGGGANVTIVGPLTAAGDALAGAHTGLDTLAFNLFYDGTNYRRWLGAQLNNGTYGTTGHAPFTQSFLYGWDLPGATTWHRINVDANGSLITNQTTSYPGYFRLQDQNGTTAVDTLVMAGADMATTEVGMYSLAGNYFWGNTLSKFTRWNGNTLAADTATPIAPFVGSFGMVYDIANTNWNMMTSHLIADNLSATPEGLDTLSYTLFYNGSNYQRWLGATAGNDNVVTTTVAPWVGNFNMGYDTVGGNWDRLSLHAAGDALSATQMGLDTTAFVHFFNGTNEQRWTGSILSGETVANTTYAPHAKNMLYGYDATSSSWRWVNVLDSVTDNIAVSQNSLMTTSVMMAYDGATLDMLRVGAVGELQVTDVATRPGEDAANDLVKMKKVDTGTLAPAKTTTASIGAAATVVLTLEVLSYPNYCVYLKNNDGADSFTDMDFQVSPDNTGWVDLSEIASCDTLATGLLCRFCSNGNADRYMRVRVTGAAGPSIDSVDAWITANKN